MHILSVIVLVGLAIVLLPALLSVVGALLGLFFVGMGDLQHGVAPETGDPVSRMLVAGIVEL